jgi:hypothetical protein
MRKYAHLVKAARGTQLQRVQHSHVQNRRRDCSEETHSFFTKKVSIRPASAFQPPAPSSDEGVNAVELNKKYR